ncbi:DUF5606 domain-containing protein [soil metagenome]
MEFKEIAAISGKGGLYRITKPTLTGVIVESIDEKNNRMVASATNRISILKEISVYTTTQEGSTPLETVLRKIYEEFQEDPGVSGNSDPEELKAFIKHVVPDYDPSRVYVSDIKKIISWYNILFKFAPEVLQEQDNPETEIKEDQADEISNDSSKTDTGGEVKAEAQEKSEKPKKEEVQVEKSNVKEEASKAKNTK